MSGLDKHVIQWWDRLNNDQRSRVQQAAENHRLDPAGVKALIDTRCPIGPVGSRWEADPEYSWTWPESLRQFVLDQK